MFEDKKTEKATEESRESEAEQKLRLFREEFERRHEEDMKIAEEAQRTGEKAGEAIHFADPSFNVAELTGEDMAIWEKVKDGSLTWKDYEEYRARLLSRGVLTKREGMKMSSREVFFDSIGTLAQKILLRKPREHAGN